MQGLRIRLVAEMATVEQPLLTNNKVAVAVAVALPSQAVITMLGVLGLGRRAFSHS